MPTASSGPSGRRRSSRPSDRTSSTGPDATSSAGDLPEDELDVDASDDDLADDRDELSVFADDDDLDDDLDDDADDADDEVDGDEVDDADDEDDEDRPRGATLTKTRTRAAGSKTSTRKDVAKRPGTKRKRSRRDQRSGNVFAFLVRFVREVVAEMRKVLWPTRRELGVFTVAVIIFVAVMIAIVGALDYGFARLVLAVFG